MYTKSRTVLLGFLGIVCQSTVFGYTTTDRGDLISHNYGTVYFVPQKPTYNFTVRASGSDNYEPINAMQYIRQQRERAMEYNFEKDQAEQQQRMVAQLTSPSPSPQTHRTTKIHRHKHAVSAVHVAANNRVSKTDLQKLYANTCAVLDNRQLSEQERQRYYQRAQALQRALKNSNNTLKNHEPLNKDQRFVLSKLHARADTFAHIAGDAVQVQLHKETVSVFAQLYHAANRWLASAHQAIDAHKIEAIRDETAFVGAQYAVLAHECNRVKQVKLGFNLVDVAHAAAMVVTVAGRVLDAHMQIVGSELFSFDVGAVAGLAQVTVGVGDAVANPVQTTRQFVHACAQFGRELGRAMFNVMPQLVAGIDPEMRKRLPDAFRRSDRYWHETAQYAEHVLRTGKQYYQTHSGPEICAQTGQSVTPLVIEPMVYGAAIASTLRVLERGVSAMSRAESLAVRAARVEDLAVQAQRELVCEAAYAQVGNAATEELAAHAPAVQVVQIAEKEESPLVLRQAQDARDFAQPSVPDKLSAKVVTQTASIPQPTQTPVPEIIKNGTAVIPAQPTSAYEVAQPIGVIEPLPPVKPLTHAQRLGQVFQDRYKTWAMHKQVATLEQVLVNAAQRCQVLSSKIKVQSADLWHLLVADVRQNIKSGKCKINGFHWDQEGQLQKAGLIEVLDKRVDPVHGATLCKLKIGDVIKAPVTLFPENWSLEKIVDTIVESLVDIVKADIEPSGTMVITGQTKGGFKVTAIIDKNGKIVTAYPDQTMFRGL